MTSARCLQAKRAARTTVEFWQAVGTQSELLERPMTPGKLFARRASSSNLRWVLASSWHADERLQLPMTSGKLFARRASSSNYRCLLASCLRSKREARTTVGFGQAVGTQSVQLGLPGTSDKRLARSASSSNHRWVLASLLHAERAARTTYEFWQLFARKASSSHYQ